MKIRLASKLQYDSIVDGEGIRTVIWTQGCQHKCHGCHNPETHSLDGGFQTDTEYIKKNLLLINNQSGITLSGGDPFFQPEACYDIVSFAKQIGLNVWCYTGYTFEKILDMATKNDIYIKLLQNIDVLIDGPFILSQRNLSLKFRGSNNQRIIDVKQSLAKRKVITKKEYDQSNINTDLYQKPEHIFI